MAAVLSPSWGLRLPLATRATTYSHRVCAVEARGNFPRQAGTGCRARAGCRDGAARRVAPTPCTAAAASQLVQRAPAPQVTTTCVKPAAVAPATSRAMMRAPSCGASLGAPGTSEAVPPPLPSLGPMPVSFSSRSQPTNGQVTKKVLCYGDSLTAGFCSEGRQYEPYGRALAEALSQAGASCEVSVCGHSGHTTAQMVANLDEIAVSDVGGMIGKGLRRCLDEIRPDLVVIMTGTNDLGKERHPQSVLEDIGRLHAVCHSRGVPTVALAPPPAPMAPQGTSFEAKRRRLVSLLSEWSLRAAGTLTFADPGDMVPAQAGPGNRVWDADKLHLSPAGSRVLAQQLAALLAPLPALNAAAGALSKVASQAFNTHHPSCAQLV